MTNLATSEADRGSVSEACISHASCPIAVVPAAGAASR
jgi:nucleotide-binding universal stress UspA family protein